MSSAENLKRGGCRCLLAEADIRAMAILEPNNWVQAKAFTDYLSKLLPLRKMNGCR